MEQSMFQQFLTKWFAGIVLSVTTKLNDKKDGLLSYLHKRMLKKDYSVDGKWTSFNSSYTQVMADVVAMDSSLPLKKRDSLSKANGDIPKMGLEMKLNEKQLTDLGVLQAQQGQEAVILKKVFEDTPKVISAVYERCEAIFLEGLSTGVCIVEDPENVGTGIRLDYGYPVENKFGAEAAVWSSTSTAKPLSDFQRIITFASNKGYAISNVMMDRTAFNNMVKTAEVKEHFAFSQGFTGTSVPTPTLTQVNTLVSDRFGFTIEIVDRSVRSERNGQQTAMKPWADGAVVFLTTTEVGSLVYARLAEQDHPVTGIAYEVADEHILVSKFRTNRPSLAEFTTSQARVIPVISGVDGIFTLDTKTLQA